MGESKKLSELELLNIKAIREDSLEVASVLGELEFQKTIIEDQIRQQKDKVLQIKKKETSLLAELKDKYGSVTINIETGEIE